MSSHRYWRFADWRLRLPNNNYSRHQDDVLLREFRLFLDDGSQVLDSSVITFKNLNSGVAANLIDGNFDTHLGSKLRAEGASVWWLQYSFAQPVTPKSIITVGWDGIGLELKQTSAYYSDNGVDWFYYATCFINQPENFVGYIATELTSVDLININKTDKYIDINIYKTDDSGSLSGLVTQGKSGEPKLPLKAEVLLYDRMTNKLLQRTWSDNLGAYSFSGLDSGRDYYVVTLHPNRTYNAAIQDGLKSGMTT